MKTLIIACVMMPIAANAETWTYEKHGDVIYGHGPNGEKSTEEEHNGVTYGHDSNEKSWTIEQHGDTIYRRNK